MTDDAKETLYTVILFIPVLLMFWYVWSPGGQNPTGHGKLNEVECNGTEVHQLDGESYQLCSINGVTFKQHIVNR